MTRLLKRVLSDVLQSDELAELLTGFDIIGDIAIIKVPDSLLPRARLIGERLLSNLKYIKSVYRQSSPVAGQFRVRGLEHLAGEQKTSTIHKEYGCIYKVDVAKVFFSPRLSTERSRIADMVLEGEVVANLFSGVGPFSILIAKRKKNVVIHSIEANTEAYKLMVENIRLNKVGDKITPYLGDAREIVPRIENMADRVLMPHPEEADRFIESALRTLKPNGGTMHFYKFSRESLTFEETWLQDRIPYPSKITGSRKVREIGPGVNEIAIDLQIYKENGRK